MGTTSRGYPYPEGSDYVASGDDAIQGLAEAVNADVGGYVAAQAAAQAAREVDHAVVIARADSGGGVGAPSVLDFPGARLRMDGFTYSSGSITYDGPPRTFMVDVEVQTTGGGGVPGIGSTVEVRVNGTAFAGSYDSLDLSAGSISSRSVVHRITTPVRISAGDVLDVVPSSSPGGTLDVCGLRIYPIGPAS